MKLIAKRCFGVTLLAGMFLAGTTSAQTDEPSVKAAKSQVKEDQATRVKGEQDAKAQREADIAQQEKNIRDADALVKAGRPSEAYDLLAPMEFERSGDVRFDYLLGIAALDSGKPDKATLAFERVMAVNPNFAGARMDMARAYFDLGDISRAKVEFKELLKQDPPESVRVTIQKYLTAIEEKSNAKHNFVFGYFETSAGYDTNVNAATSQSLVPVPVLGNIPITLTSSQTKTGDDYFGINGGLNVVHPLSQKLAFYVGTDIRLRDNLTQNNFDTMNLNGNIGGIYTFRPEDSLKLGLSSGTFSLGGVGYFDTEGENGEWRHIFSIENQMSIFAQEMRYGFINSSVYPNMGNQNFNQDTLGTNWTHVMTSSKSKVFVNLFAGQETDVTGLRPDGGKAFNGFRVGAEKTQNEKIKIFANVGRNDGTYTKGNAIFLVTRHDTLTDATLGANMRWNKLWSVRPQITWSRNESNISLYGYDRIDTSVTLRHDFD